MCREVHALGCLETKRWVGRHACVPAGIGWDACAESYVYIHVGCEEECFIDMYTFGTDGKREDGWLGGIRSRGECGRVLSLGTHFAMQERSWSLVSPACERLLYVLLGIYDQIHLNNVGRSSS